MGIKLTPRDAAVIRFVATHRIVPIDLLAERFFDRDPFNGIANKDPVDACARRLRALAADGLLWLRSMDDGKREQRVVTLGPKSENVTGTRPDARRVPARNRAHHLRTIDALRGIERAVRARGGRVLDTRYEQDLRADLQRGRRTRRGQTYPAFPDAVITYESIARSGARVVREVAVEYVTSKYTDADIRKKAASFGRFAMALWVADRASTAKRVTRLTGAPCTVLS